MQPIHTLSFIVHLHQKEKNTKKMEGCDQNGSGVGNGGSRWNPTKDQINMLEGLYKQGLRTPSAQQIQQITARLRDFGHIEGKNVFYWFQNHKARQRQKQKQIKHDNFAYFNRFTHPPNPVFPPFQNVVCSPCYSMPPPNPSGFYQQYPKVQPPTAAGGGGGNIVMKRNSRVVIPDQSSCDTNADVARYNKPMHEYYNPRRQSPHHHQETLDLFPIHPTGVLIENKKKKPTNTSSSSEHDNDQSALAHEKAGKDNHFFEFFSCHD